MMGMLQLMPALVEMVENPDCVKDILAAQLRGLLRGGGSPRALGVVALLGTKHPSQGSPLRLPLTFRLIRYRSKSSFHP